MNSLCRRFSIVAPAGKSFQVRTRCKSNNQDLRTALAKRLERKRLACILRNVNVSAASDTLALQSLSTRRLPQLN
jgi:hypothetical protein